MSHSHILTWLAIVYSVFPLIVSGVATLNTMIVMRCETFFQARVLAGPQSTPEYKDRYFSASRQIMTLCGIQVAFLAVAVFAVFKVSGVLREMLLKSIIEEIQIDKLSDLYELNLVTESTTR